MTEGAGPVMGRRRLAAELRRLRTAAGKTIYEVAESMECSTGKISRIETGSVGARLQDVREMLDLYGVSGPKRTELLELVRQARQKPWWLAYADVVPPGSSTLYGLEAAATIIYEHSYALVPGLLQTAGYTEALISASGEANPDQVKRRVELRMRRQELLTRDDGPQFVTIIGEAALHEPLGGPVVMAEQLRYLAAVAQGPRTTIQVRPFGSGRPIAIGAPFKIFSFADPAYGKVVFLEGLRRNTFLEETRDVDFYTSLFTDISEGSLSPSDSQEMLGRAAESFN
jgi:transcriptional regulator with XRE-family HTH domain